MPDFSTTRWSLVRRAAEPSAGGRRALGELLTLYEPALRAQLARWRVPGADGDDLWQEFVARLLEHDWLQRADPAAGHFRAFIATALQRFAANRLRAETAEKRGGAMTAADTLDELAAAEPGPDRRFDADWARLVFERALRRLRAEAVERGKGELFDALEPFLAEDAQRDDYVRIAPRFGSNAHAIGVAVHRLRTRLRDLLRDEVLQTLDDETQATAELEALRDALRD